MKSNAGPTGGSKLQKKKKKVGRKLGVTALEKERKRQKEQEKDKEKGFKKDNGHSVKLAHGVVGSFLR